MEVVRVDGTPLQADMFNTTAYGKAVVRYTQAVKYSPPAVKTNGA
jgi:hypothetical protein